MVETLKFNSFTSKGMVGEDLFVVIFIIILMFVFFAALNQTYFNYLNVQEMVERTRVASAISWLIYFKNNGTIREPIDCDGFEWKKTYVLFYKQGIKIASCPGDPTQQETGMIVTSIPINYMSSSGWSAGKVEVYVEK